MRVFLALELPDGVKEAMVRLLESLRPELRGWRWVEAGSGHLTLRFLGEVAGEILDAHRPRWRAAVERAQPFRFRIGGLGVFPDASRPRVLWAGVREVEPEGAFSALARELEATARELGFAPETRPFHPHLTLARARRGARPQAPRPGTACELGVVEATRVTLFESHLSPAGARYTPLAHFPLRGARGEG